MINFKKAFKSLFFPLIFITSVIFLFSCGDVIDNGVISNNGKNNLGDLVPCNPKNNCVVSNSCVPTHCCIDFDGVLPPLQTCGFMKVYGFDCNGEAFYCEYYFLYNNLPTGQGNFVPDYGSYTFEAWLGNGDDWTYHGSTQVVLPTNNGYPPITLKREKSSKKL